MNEKARKEVLIVDDEPRMCESLRDQFTDCNEEANCPYEFEVDVALSAAECVKKVRSKNAGAGKLPYDVIVLDIRMEEEKSGLEASSALHQQLGWEAPVRIIFTGFPSYRQCVEAIHHGAWDYIVKEDVGVTLAAQIVVDSALARLQQIDLRQEQERRIAEDWLPRRLRELQEEYGGQFVALWDEEEVAVIASGRDTFELETRLKDWRKQHKYWEQPMVVLIPPQRGEPEQEV